MKYLPSAALLIAGLIHLLPIPGVMGVPVLFRLYGIEISDPNIAILLQHRALMFAILGVIMLTAIRLEFLQITALSTGLVSTTSFIGVAAWVGHYNHAIQRVVIADIVASIALTVGLVAAVWLRRQASP
jgi:hypothetical protein